MVMLENKTRKGDFGATRVLVGQTWWVSTGNSCVDTRFHYVPAWIGPVWSYYLFVCTVSGGVVLHYRLDKGWDLSVCMYFLRHF